MSNSIIDQINADLAAFQADPHAFMNRQPPKMDAAGNPVKGFTVFSESAIAEKAYIDARDQQRLNQLQATTGQAGAPGTRAAILSNDKPANLVDRLVHNRLTDMEAANLRKATLAESPWSDDYWAIYKGILGARYADPNFPKAPDWKANYDYIRANPAAKILASGNANQINRLSPSEKYDALIGDSNETLTKKMWADGKYYYDRFGKVETWMGICHGWAPVAYMLPRPSQGLTLKTPNGINIKFFPSDIKALGSLLWANAAPRTRFIGGRCNDKNPALDGSTGRVTSADCFDTNPGTWHLAIVNQIGVAQRSMVLDITFDYEVWNQPIYAYEYRYFNPKTMYYAGSLTEATVKRSDFNNDRFARFRSPNYASVVGIHMEVSYVVETTPSHRETDTSQQDAIQKVAYYYDLELDEAGNIIGGEWYGNKHPDFLWTPAPNIRAVTAYEAEATGTWQQENALPTTWRNAARRAAIQGAPLAAIVEHLIKFANGQQLAPTPQPAPRISPIPAPDPRTTPPPAPEPVPVPSPAPPPRAESWWERLLRWLFGR